MHTCASGVIMVWAGQRGRCCPLPPNPVIPIIRWLCEATHVSIKTTHYITSTYTIRTSALRICKLYCKCTGVNIKQMFLYFYCATCMSKVQIKMLYMSSTSNPFNMFKIQICSLPLCEKWYLCI